jgi:DNA mismatch repair ATPase MutS
MLKLYYRIFTDSVIKESIEYSFGFEGYLDNLRSLSEHIKKGDLAFATFSTDTATTIEKQYYPSFMNGTPIKNDVSLEKNIIITGPNASGKTTMLKTTTLNIIFSQQFGCGFYDTATIKPYTHIHSYLNIPDTSERDSLFQAESRRCKDILTSIQSTDKGTGTEAHHLCIFDELYSGTNYKDATKSATSFLKYLSKNKTVDYLLTTHYTLVCKNLESNKRIQLCKMDVEVLEGGEFVYLYKMKKGISEIEGGVNILKEMDYPDEIINSIMNEKENGDEKEKEIDN